MTFANPLFFWAFISLLPLVAVYFLKVRPRRKSTTAYFLWEKILQEKRTTSLWRRLRDFWSLLLMALAFSAVAVALAGPRWTGDERKDALILLDHSASMNARDGNRTRLERGKEIAADIVRGFSGSQRAAVATVGRDLLYRSHLTDNPRELLDAVNGVESTDYSQRSDVFGALDSNNQWFSQHRVILISDGCFDRDSMPDYVELLKVGQEARNIGIISTDMQYLPGSDLQLGFYFQVASTHDELVKIDLLVSRMDDTGKDTLFKVIPLEVEPGVNQPQVYTLENAPPGRWLATLDGDDALSKDNVAYLAVERPRPVPVMVQSDDRFFLENSVAAFSRGAGLLELTENNPRIVLGKSLTPDADNALIFQPAGESPWWSGIGEEVEAPAPRVLIEDHPALRFLEPTTIPFLGARRLEPPEDAQVWVASDDGVPLIYRASKDGRSAVVVNMDPVASEFYFSAWFPVLVHSVSTYLAGREEQLMASYRPGDTVTVPGVRDDQQTSVSGPSGDRYDVTGKRLPPLARLGFYELQNEGGDWLVACSLLSKEETLLDNEQVKDTTQPISRGWAPAQLLTLLAVLVLTAESLLYHRRKVG